MSTWTMARAPTSALRRRRRRLKRGRGATPTSRTSLDGLALDVLAQRRDLALQEPDAFEELLDGTRDGVGKIRLVQIDLSLHAAPVAMGDATGHADHDRVRRHLAHDHRPRADAAAVADHERADDLGPRADHHVIAEGRMALLLLQARATERDALEQRHVLADLGGLPNDHAHSVIDEEARPE